MVNYSWVIYMKSTFGEKIKFLREKNDLSQTELGSSVEMTQRKVSYLESGKYEPNLEDIRQLCHFFNVSADYLLDLPGNLPNPDRPVRT